MDQTLAYLRETLSNYEERELANTIYNKLKKPWTNEKEFVDHLEQEEIQYLSKMLPKELEYAKDEQDDKRYNELMNVFEQLY